MNNLLYHEDTQTDTHSNSRSLLDFSQDDILPSKTVKKSSKNESNEEISWNNVKNLQNSNMHY